MKKNIDLLIFIVILAAVFRICFTIIMYKNTNYEEHGEVLGIITNIQLKNDKTIIDIKNKIKYRVTIYKNKKSFHLGDKVLVSGLVYMPNDNTVFNLFNYHKYLLSKRIFYLVKADKVTLITKNKNIFYATKTLMQKRINKYKSKKYLNAFILGDTSSIEEDNKRNYQTIGISHLLAVSGMHVGMLLVILNFILKKLKYKDLLIGFFLLFFLFITNFTESLLRCTSFLFINYLNKKFNLKVKHTLVLLFAASLLILYNPYLIYSVGFCFSFCITFYIILASKVINAQKGYFKKLLTTSLISFLASIPIEGYVYFKFNVLSWVYNLFFVPFVSIILFPLSLLTFIFPFLDSFLMLFIKLFEGVASLFSNFKLAVFIISKVPLIITLLYYLTLYLTFKLNRKFLFVFLFMLFININTRFFITSPKVIFMDVGQGDATMFVFPYGHVVMIDTGGKVGSTYSLSTGSAIPYLNSIGINKIDYLILTHGDYDHIGESSKLVENIKVDNVIFNPGKFNTLEKSLIEILNEKKIKYYQDVDIFNIKNYKLYFLNTSLYDNENDNSNVIYTKINNTKLLFMADASITREKDILKTYDLTNIDILKVGHHGSNTSSGKKFIHRIKPKNCIISVGKNNRYGHPKESTLNTLKESKIYRTDKDGSIEIKLDKDGYKVSTCPP